MSYDVSIGDFEANYTSNLSGFFHDHIIGEGCTGLQSLHELTGEQASVVLGAAVERIYNARSGGESEMRNKYDAPNGWGSIFGATVLLSRLIVACHKHPERLINVSC